MIFVLIAIYMPIDVDL